MKLVYKISDAGFEDRLQQPLLHSLPPSPKGELDKSHHDLNTHYINKIEG
jgi:hypothetical protein